MRAPVTVLKSSGRLSFFGEIADLAEPADQSAACRGPPPCCSGCRRFGNGVLAHVRTPGGPTSAAHTTSTSSVFPSLSLRPSLIRSTPVVRDPYARQRGEGRCREASAIKSMSDFRQCRISDCTENQLTHCFNKFFVFGSVFARGSPNTSARRRPMIMLTENAVAAVKTALSGAARPAEGRIQGLYREGPLPSRPGNSHSYSRGSRQ
ncbi:hypothetical protein HNQ71_006576 [Mesorhizobium sangaii]|uniref:Uncharacterized protein n=1 Tax=Mesorhizobium sangaii TaxID=505389 RepID=A0A841PF92_9HYPH|nr:hypothetical protein [Mesorhizobium sangaii]